MATETAKPGTPQPRGAGSHICLYVFGSQNQSLLMRIIFTSIGVITLCRYTGARTCHRSRTSKLSSYSYLIIPTDTSGGFTTAKDNTLGDFGQYLLLYQGQTEVDALGYSALPPVNLVEVPTDGR